MIIFFVIITGSQNLNYSQCYNVYTTTFWSLSLPPALTSVYSFIRLSFNDSILNNYIIQGVGGKTEHGSACRPPPRCFQAGPFTLRGCWGARAARPNGCQPGQPGLAQPLATPEARRGGSGRAAPQRRGRGSPEGRLAAGPASNKRFAGSSGPRILRIGLSCCVLVCVVFLMLFV